MIAGSLARVRSLWRGLRRRADVEADMAEEFRLHQELRAADLVRAGLSPAEAARQARLDFGPAEMHNDGARAAPDAGGTPRPCRPRPRRGDAARATASARAPGVRRSSRPLRRGRVRHRANERREVASVVSHRFSYVA